MGRQESLEFYLNLSRKELQGLCKGSNLPANRSHVQLAKSLVSHFKVNSSAVYCNLLTGKEQFIFLISCHSLLNKMSKLDSIFC